MSGVLGRSSRSMGIMGQGYELTCLLERSGADADWRMLAVVVWRDHTVSGARRARGAAGDGTPGHGEVRHLSTQGALRIGGCEYAIPADGRSLRLLAERRADGAVRVVRIDAADVPPPPEMQDSRWSLVWHVVRRRLLRWSVPPHPVEHWAAGIISAPPVQTFLAARPADEAT